MNKFAKIILLLGILALNTFCKSKTITNSITYTNSTTKPVIDFDTTSHNFGLLKKGDECIHEFVFKNNGKEDLILLESKASCECTSPEYSKEPIKADATGKVKVIYNSKNIGGFLTSVTVISNASNSPTVLNITGTVIPE